MNFILWLICLGSLVLKAQLPEQKIVPADNRSGDFFGRYISMQYPDILISAHQKDIFGYASGAVYVYRANDQNSPFSEFQMIFPPDGHVEEFFGYSTDMESEWAIVGSHHDSDAGGSSGSVFILKRENSLWTLSRKLHAPDASPGDEFGKAVSLHQNEVFAGAWLDDDQGSNSGSVYVFERQGSLWVQTAKLYPDPANPYDQFGNFLASSGNHLLVGVPENNAKGPRSGCAYIFEKGSFGWQQADRWIPPDGHHGDQFGNAVSIDQSRAAVGAFQSDISCTDGGAVYLYYKNGDTWIYDTTLIPADLNIGDQFGVSVHIEGDLLAAGAYFDDDLGSNSGSVYLYRFINEEWKLLTKINASDGQAGDAFGSSVHINFPWLAVGAYGKSQNGFFSGGAYVYNIQELVTSTEFMGSEDRKFKLYPTLFNHRICLDQDETLFERARISLFSSEGSQLYSGIIEPGQACIDTFGLPAGLIIYKVTSTAGIQTGILIKEPDH